MFLNEWNVKLSGQNHGMILLFHSLVELKPGGHMKLLSFLKAGAVYLIAGIATVSAGDSTTLGTSAGLPMSLPIATEGTACSGVGLTAFSSSGLILSCQSGVWKGNSQEPGGGFQLVRTTGGCRVANPRTGSCTCPSGTIAIHVGQLFWYSQWDTHGYACN